MKYTSIAIITSGDSPLKNDVLEIGAIVEDTKNKLSFESLPKMRFWINKEYYRGRPDYLVTHKPTLELISELRNKYSQNLISPELGDRRDRHRTCVRKYLLHQQQEQCQTNQLLSTWQIEIHHLQQMP